MQKTVPGSRSRYSPILNRAMSRQHRARVRGVTQLRSNRRSIVDGPLPSWLIGRAPECDISDVHNFEPAVGKFENFIRIFKGLQQRFRHLWLPNLVAGLGGTLSATLQAATLSILQQATRHLNREQVAGAAIGRTIRPILYDAGARSRGTLRFGRAGQLKFKLQAPWCPNDLRR